MNRADLEAAERLRAQSRHVETHHQFERPAERRGGPRKGSERAGRGIAFGKAHKKGRALTVIFGKGGKARPVRIEGRTFPSVSDAARRLHKSPRTLYELLRTGTACYV